MRFEYHIFHSEKTKREPIPNPFSEEEELYQYRHFPTSFNEHYERKYATPIAHSCVPAIPVKDGLQVTLDTELSKAEVDNSLRELLVDLNTQIPGLNLVCATWVVIVTKDGSIAERSKHPIKSEAESYATQKREEGYETNVIPCL